MHGNRSHRLLELLNTSFPIFTIKGFPVRVHWTVILFVLYFISEFGVV